MNYQGSVGIEVPLTPTVLCWSEGSFSNYSQFAPNTLPPFEKGHLFSPGHIVPWKVMARRDKHVILTASLFSSVFLILFSGTHIKTGLSFDHFDLICPETFPNSPNDLVSIATFDNQRSLPISLVVSPFSRELYGFWFLSAWTPRGEGGGRGPPEEGKNQAAPKLFGYSVPISEFLTPGSSLIVLRRAKSRERAIHGVPLTASPLPLWPKAWLVVFLFTMSVIQLLPLPGMAVNSSKNSSAYRSSAFQFYPLNFFSPVPPLKLGEATSIPLTRWIYFP